MSRSMIEDHEMGTTSGVGTADWDGAATAVPENPIDAFFAGSRWRREDVIFAVSALNLLVVLIAIATMIYNNHRTTRLLEVSALGA